MKIEELQKPLDRAKVSTRSQAGRDLSYIEGWWAISEANRIFGFDGWERTLVRNEEVCRYEYNGKNKVGYEAVVKITVQKGDGEWVVRYGTGHGSGIAKDLFDAIEGAAKEAETDAMKRALMTFGNPFGLALYDKTQANVADQAQIDLQNAIEAHSKTIETIKTALASGTSNENLSVAAEAWYELTEEEMKSIWVAPSKGGPFTTKEREIMKSQEFRQAHFGEENAN